MKPEEEKRTYYIYGIWHIYDHKPYVTDDWGIAIYQCDNIDDALFRLKLESLSNGNITWCLTWDRKYVEKMAKDFRSGRIYSA